MQWFGAGSVAAASQDLPASVPSNKPSPLPACHGLSLGTVQALPVVVDAATKDAASIAEREQGVRGDGERVAFRLRLGLALLLVAAKRGL
jgi:hypothetical protein